MASMKRSIMRQNRSAGLGSRAGMSGGVSMGSVRAGMHQSAEHAFQRSAMAIDAVPVEEEPEELIDSEAPAELVEDEVVSDPIPDVVAEGDAEIVPDGGLLEEVAAEQTEDLTPGVEDIPVEEDVLSEDGSEDEKETCSCSNGSCSCKKKMSVDMSGERVPVLNYAPSADAAPRELVYSQGDAGARDIELPAVFQEEIAPVTPEVVGPSANVPAAAD